MDPQSYKRSTASHMRHALSKSLARFSAALHELSEKLADPATRPESKQVVNVDTIKSVEVPLPPNLSLSPEDFRNFKAIASGGYNNIGIAPCYVNREASSAIVAVRKFKDHVEVHPMFVAVTHSMQLLDQFGVALTKHIDDAPEAQEAKRQLDIIVHRRNVE